MNIWDSKDRNLPYILAESKGFKSSSEYLKHPTDSTEVRPGRRIRPPSGSARRGGPGSGHHWAPPPRPLRCVGHRRTCTLHNLVLFHDWRPKRLPKIPLQTSERKITAANRRARKLGKKLWARSLLLFHRGGAREKNDPVLPDHSNKLLATC